MIQDEEHLHRTREALQDLEAALASLNHRKGEIHPERIALMAEPIVDHIERLRLEIDEYHRLAAVQAAPQH
jgi:hypothetical protein